MKKIMIAIISMVFMAPSISFAQKVTIENKRIYIDCSDMSANVVETRTADFAPGGRVKRHIRNSDVDLKISRKFEITHKFIQADGTQGDAAITWAEAAGWTTGTEEDRNGANYSLTAGEPAQTGCCIYKGPDNNDPPGTWRLPTRREAELYQMLISSKKKCERYNIEHVEDWRMSWSATEIADQHAASLSNLWIYEVNHVGKTDSYNDKAYTSYNELGVKICRCIRDL